MFRRRMGWRRFLVLVRNLSANAAWRAWQPADAAIPTKPQSKADLPVSELMAFVRSQGG